MNLFALEEFKFIGSVRFYTVRYVDSELSETDKFIKKFREDGFYKELLSDLLNLVIEIGQRGASDKYFNRKENDFHALPPYEGTRLNFQGEQLRLYCLKLSDSVVVLFNGGIKDKRTAQFSKCSMQFYEAQNFTKKIDEAIKNRTIALGKSLIFETNNRSKEIIL